MENKENIVARNRHLKPDLTDEQIIALGEQLENEHDLTEDDLKPFEAPAGECPSAGDNKGWPGSH